MTQVPALPASAGDTMADGALTETISALDSKVFDAYNRCDMTAYRNYFSRTVEFYHDKDGATFDRDTVIANTKKYICGKVYGHRPVTESDDGAR